MSANTPQTPNEHEVLYPMGDSRAPRETEIDARPRRRNAGRGRILPWILWVWAIVTVVAAYVWLWLPKVAELNFSNHLLAQASANVASLQRKVDTIGRAAHDNDAERDGLRHKLESQQVQSHWSEDLQQISSQRLAKQLDAGAIRMIAGEHSLLYVLQPNQLFAQLQPQAELQSAALAVAQVVAAQTHADASRCEIRVFVCRADQATLLAVSTGKSKRALRKRRPEPSPTAQSQTLGAEAVAGMRAAALTQLVAQALAQAPGVDVYAAFGAPTAAMALRDNWHKQGCAVVEVRAMPAVTP